MAIVVEVVIVTLGSREREREKEKAGKQTREGLEKGRKLSVHSL